VNTVRFVIRHESNWVRWKVMGCPSFDQLPMTIDEELIRQQEERAQVKSTPLTYPLGTEELSTLWEDNEQDDMAFLSDPSRRHHVPDVCKYIDDFLSEYPNDFKSEETDAQQNVERIKETFLPSNLPELYQESRLAKMWRAIRLASTQRIRSVCDIPHGDLAELRRRLNMSEEEEAARELEKELEKEMEMTDANDEPALGKEDVSQLEEKDASSTEKGDIMEVDMAEDEVTAQPSQEYVFSSSSSESGVANDVDDDDDDDDVASANFDEGIHQENNNDDYRFEEEAEAEESDGLASRVDDIDISDTEQFEQSLIDQSFNLASQTTSIASEPENADVSMTEL
jgi:hypothetical protein